MRHHARRALGVALSVAERSLDQLLPPSNGPPASPYNQVWQPNWVTPHGLVPQPCAAPGAVFDPARQTWARACGGPGVNLMGCSTYGQPMPGPPPLTRPPVAASGARPDVGPPRQQRQPDASTRHSSRRSADGNVRRSRSRARRSAVLSGRPRRSSPRRARAGGAAPVRSQQARSMLLSLQDNLLLLQLADLSFRGRGDQVLQQLVKRGHVAPEPQDRQQPVHQ